MSLQRTKFEQAVAKGDWTEAFLRLNGLNMEEMLDALAALPKATLDKLIERRFTFKMGESMARMEYAWSVVKNRELPLVAPGDLVQTGQVETAARFLKKASSRSQITLNLIVFTDAIVTNRTLFPELRQKAEQILAAQGNNFKLDVTVHPTDIKYSEVVYLQPQIDEMVELAKNATTVPNNRLMVLLVRVSPKVSIHGLAAKVNGQRAVIIDTDTPNPDRATLLHEIGHCAGLPHAGEAPAGKPSPVDVGDQTNVMAEAKANVTRNKLTVTQGEFLAKAFFATK